ncbi:hypothetical protein [Haloprofundus salilacus]|uniref:hypothetical protein n=1 Tax=Haloprofundus salilacus TaxID=2876190 RepID=UPI001CCA205F|nr:hypothetical protein [Haloprofundus salilacus]
MENIHNLVKFDRVTDKPLSGRIRGSFNTTQKDAHGHVVSDKLYPEYIESMKQHPERRIVSIHHNRDDPMGEILWAGIQEEDDVTHLVGEVGLYEDIEHREDEIDRLGGFSVSLVGYENTKEEAWNPNQINFRYLGLGEDYHQLKEAISEKGVPARLEVQKSAEGAFIVDVVANNIPLLIELALVAYTINRERKESNKEHDTTPEIVVNEMQINLKDKELPDFLEQLSDAVGENIGLDPEQAEVLMEALEDDDAKVEFEVKSEDE